MPMTNPFAPGPGAAVREAQAAIRALGPLARAQVGPSTHDWFGRWLAWPEWLFAGTGIRPTTSALPARISVADDLMMAANIIDNDAAPGLLERIALGHMPSVGPVSMMAQIHSPTLGDYVRFLPRSINGNTLYVNFQLYEHPDSCSLVLDSQVVGGSLRSFVGLLAALVSGRTFEACIAGQEQRALIETDWPFASGGEAIAQRMPIPIKWAADVNRLTFPADWMAIRNPWADEGLWLLAQERLRALELARGAEMQVAELRSSVATILTRDRRMPRFKQLAASHGMSERSLGRLLAAGGTSFQAIVDDERRSRAAQMINDPTLSLKDMADLLGYPDVSGFGRCFRRWFGQTPGEFRRRLPAADR
jgi:AraC-like DNA-binding protein